jgi:hypothetical protein
MLSDPESNLAAATLAGQLAASIEKQNPRNHLAPFVYTSWLLAG